MANIRVTCPTCKSELEIDEAFDGQEVECGNCLQVFVAKGPKSSRPGTGKIPGASSSGSGRSRPSDRPKPKSRRRDDDDDYAHDRRKEEDDEDYPPPPERRTGGGGGTGLGVTSLVFGIVAIVVCCCPLISFPAGITATITGAIGLKSENKGMAVAGLVLGVIGMGLSGLVLLGNFGNAIVNPNQFR